VHRILTRHGMPRLPANQKHQPHGKRWQRYEKPQPGHRLQLDVKFLGSIRRECLDHVIVVNETGLSRILMRYVAYYHESRTHLSLAKDSPQPRPIARPTIGPVVAIPQVGGLHHR
jgi:hypothetical protein